MATQEKNTQQMLEELFEAVSYIADSKVKKVNFNRTIVCTITNNDNRDKGEYTVTDGTSSFLAYSENTTYAKDIKVYVTIPNGDYDNQKLIVGKYVEESSEYFTYSSPLDSFVDLTGNLFKAQNNRYGLVPNSYTASGIDKYPNSNNDVVVYKLDMKTKTKAEANSEFSRRIFAVGSLNANSSTEFHYNGFDRMALSANFSSFLKQYSMAKGTYGLRVIIETAGAITSSLRRYSYTLTNDEMFGNTYNYAIPSTQTKVFDISGMGEIRGLAIEFFESGDFVTDSGSKHSSTKIIDQFGYDKACSIFVSDIKFALGYDINQFTEDTVLLYTFDDSNYYYDISGKYRTAHYASLEAANTKTLMCRWIHKLEDGTMTVVSNITNADLADSNDIIVHWYHQVRDDGIEDPLAGVYWEEIPEAANKFSYRTQMDAYTAHEYFKVIVESPTRKAVSTMMNNDTELLKLFYLLNDSENNPELIDGRTFLDEKNDLVDATQTQFQDAIDEVTKLYNADPAQYEQKMQKIIQDYDTSVQAVVAKIKPINNSSGVGSGTGEYYTSASNYTATLTETKKAYMDYLAADLATKTRKARNDQADQTDAKNQEAYELYVKQLKADYDKKVSEYNSVEPEKIYDTLVATTVAKTNNNTDTLYNSSVEKLQQLQVDLRAKHAVYVENLAKYNALIAKYEAMTQYYSSEVLIFDNADDVSMLEDLMLISNFEIIVDETGYKGIYNIYDETGSLLNNNEGNKKRKLVASYNNIILDGSESMLQGAEIIQWRFPLWNTMIAEPIDGREYISKINAGNSNVKLPDETIDKNATGYVNANGVKVENKEDAVYFQITRKIEGNFMPSDYEGTEFPSQEQQLFLIKPTYNISATNNTIQCRLKRHNKWYVANADLKFGPHGNNGTDYAFTLEFEDKENPIVLYGGNQARTYKIIANLYDQEGNPANDEMLSKGYIRYSWYSGYSGKSAQGIKLSQGTGDDANKAILTTVPSVAFDNYRYYILQGTYIPQTIHSAQPNEEDVGLATHLSCLLPIPVSTIGVIRSYSGNPFIYYNSSGNSPKYFQDAFEILEYHANVTHVGLITENYRSGLVPINVSNWKVQLGTDTKTLGNYNINYYPQVNQAGMLSVPAQYYSNNGKMIALEALNNTNNVLFSLPLYIGMQLYKNSRMNSWDGKLTIDEDEGTILSTMVGAGKKDDINRFHGVLMGEVSTYAPNADSNGTDTSMYGLYGYQGNIPSFAFKVDGTAFIGPPGRGRIEFNGNSGIIQSSLYAQDKVGMQLDLDDGTLDIRGSYINQTNARFLKGDLLTASERRSINVSGVGEYWKPATDFVDFAVNRINKDNIRQIIPISYNNYQYWTDNATKDWFLTSPDQKNYYNISDSEWKVIQPQLGDASWDNINKYYTWLSVNRTATYVPSNEYVEKNIEYYVIPYTSLKQYRIEWDEEKQIGTSKKNGQPVTEDVHHVETFIWNDLEYQQYITQADITLKNYNITIINDQTAIKTYIQSGKSDVYAPLYTDTYTEAGRSQKTQASIHISPQDPYLIITDDSGKRLMQVGKTGTVGSVSTAKTGYYLQTSDYNASANPSAGIFKTGVRLDLQEGSLRAYNKFTIEALKHHSNGLYQGFVLDSGGNPYIDIRTVEHKDPQDTSTSNEEKHLFRISESEFYLQSKDWYENSSNATHNNGIRINLMTGNITAYNRFNLKVLQTTGEYANSYVQLSSSGNPYFRIHYAHTGTVTARDLEGHEYSVAENIANLDLLNITYNQFTLRSHNYKRNDNLANCDGMEIDLVNGRINAYNNFRIYSYNANSDDKYFKSYIKLGSDGDPYFQVHFHAKKDITETDADGNVIPHTVEADQNLIYITTSDFYMRSHNWNKTNDLQYNQGMQIDMVSGSITAYNRFNLQAYETESPYTGSYVQIGTGSPYFSVHQILDTSQLSSDGDGDPRRYVIANYMQSEDAFAAAKATDHLWTRSSDGTWRRVRSSSSTSWSEGADYYIDRGSIDSLKKQEVDLFYITKSDYKIQSQDFAELKINGKDVIKNGISIDLKQGKFTAYRFNLRAYSQKKWWKTTGGEHKPGRIIINSDAPGIDGLIYNTDGTLKLDDIGDISQFFTGRESHSGNAPLAVGYNFFVNWDGTMFANNGIFNGTIMATSGTIGGWYINTDGLTSFNPTGSTADGLALYSSGHDGIRIAVGQFSSSGSTTKTITYYVYDSSVTEDNFSSKNYYYWTKTEGGYAHPTSFNISTAYYKWSSGHYVYDNSVTASNFDSKKNSIYTVYFYRDKSFHADYNKRVWNSSDATNTAYGYYYSMTDTKMITLTSYISGDKGFSVNNEGLMVSKGAEITDATIDNAKITDGTITNAAISDGTITNAAISYGSISYADITYGHIGYADIGNCNLKGTLNASGGGTLSGGTVSGANLIGAGGAFNVSEDGTIDCNGWSFKKGQNWAGKADGNWHCQHIFFGGSGFDCITYSEGTMSFRSSTIDIGTSTATVKINGKEIKDMAFAESVKKKVTFDLYGKVTPTGTAETHYKLGSYFGALNYYEYGGYYFYATSKANSGWNFKSGPYYLYYAGDQYSGYSGIDDIIIHATATKNVELVAATADEGIDEATYRRWISPAVNDFSGTGDSWSISIY